MISRLFDLSGRRAFVTGSSRGIGKAVALALAEHGADVAIHYAGNEEAAAAVAAEARGLGARTALVGGDLRGECAARDAAAAAAEGLDGPLDIVVANAAVEIRRPWLKITRADSLRQVEVNLLSTLELIQATAPAMQERGWGRILTVGSVQQVRPHPDLVIYAALKAGLTNMVRNLAAQLAPSGVAVNNLAPGVILTDRNTEVLADGGYRGEVIARVPVGFIAEPSACAAAALLLCSDAARYINGIDLLVDGGMHLR